MYPAARVDARESIPVDLKSQAPRTHSEAGNAVTPAVPPAKTDAPADPSAICSITVATLNRLSIFREAEPTSACIELLISRAVSYGIVLRAYCFMPDHVHLLLSPSPDVPIIEFIRRFKSLSTRLLWERGHHGLLWQQGFYDRFLRRDDDVRQAIEYMLNNPVRAGLVSEAASYPFSGWNPREG